jgi:hypothetical protein
MTGNEAQDNGVRRSLRIRCSGPLSLSRNCVTADNDSASADEILDERLARGEISVAEFEELRGALRQRGSTA